MFSASFYGVLSASRAALWHSLGRRSCFRDGSFGSRTRCWESREKRSAADFRPDRNTKRRWRSAAGWAGAATRRWSSRSRGRRPAPQPPAKNRRRNCRSSSRATSMARSRGFFYFHSDYLGLENQDSSHRFSTILPFTFVHIYCALFKN